MKNNLNYQLQKLFLIILVLLVTPSISAEESFKPYLYNPEVPKAPALELEGSYKTELFPGAATYTYQIKLPPATNGLQPHLTLSYNSQASNSRPGILGTGWSLSQNVIQRNTNNTPSDTSDDFFTLVLQGSSEKLINSQGVYHTQIDNYMRIEFEEDSWILTAKDGTTYTFGSTPDSKLDSNLHAYTVKWSLKEIRDTHNNTITFTYAKDPDPEDLGTSYLTTIEYNQDKTRLVELSYEDTVRPDIWTSYEQGHKSSYSRRLQNIRVTAQDELVRIYQFNYTTNPEQTRSFLQTLTHTGNDGITSLPPLQITYTYPEPVWVENPSFMMPEDMPLDDEDDDQGVRFTDLNSDGLLDIIRCKEDSGDVHSNAYLNTGSGWQEAPQWKYPACSESDAFVDTDGKEYGIRFADINGDSRDDILQCYITTSALDISAVDKVFINKGNRWESDDSYTIPFSYCFVDIIPGNDPDKGVRLADVNNDGYVDLVGNWNVALNNRDKSWQEGAWSTPRRFINGGDDTGARLIEVNGDGKVDFVISNNEERTVYLNTGSGWTEDSSWGHIDAQFVTQNGEDLGIRFADLNNDGLTDLFYREINIGYDTWLNTGKGWTHNNNWLVPAEIDFVYDGVRISDVNGDGIPDFLKGLDNSNFITWTSTSKNPHHATQFTNQFGGETSIVYDQSTNLDNTNQTGLEQLPFNMWVVDEVFQDNNAPQPIIKQFVYTYAKGFFDRVNKEFTGFAEVTETISDTKKIKHLFHQDLPRKGKEYRTEIQDINENPYAVSENTWTANDQGGYYTVLLENEKSHTHDGQRENPKTTQTNYEYDTYGNRKKIIQLGDTSFSGDEKYEEHTYTYNLDAYIVDAVIQSKTYGQNQSDYRETLSSYDGLDWGTPPTKGDLTKQEAWTGTTFITNTFQHDQFGNIVNRTDGKNHSTTYQYGIRDPTHTFPESETNFLGQTTTTEYDPGTGNVLSVVDPNEYETHFVYDFFGRKQKEILPYDNAFFPTTEYLYEIGELPQKIKVSERITPLSSETFDTYYYYDGFSNLIQVKEEADQGQLIKNINYDTLFRVQKIEYPFFQEFNTEYTPIHNQYDIEYLYDPVNRVLENRNPDNTKKSVSYDHWTITSTAENNIKTEYREDAHGNIQEVKEFNNADTYTTLYDYNSFSELTVITDAEGNNVRFFYDALGRKTRDESPDRGTWHYTYDSNSNIETITDSRNIRTTIEHDELNRPTRKYSPSQEISYTYDDPVIGTLSSATSNNITTTYTYDKRLRTLSETLEVDEEILTTEYSYDSQDKIKNITYPNTESRTYRYDTGGNLNFLEGILTTITYDSFSLPTTITYTNNAFITNQYNEETHRLNKSNLSDEKVLLYTFDEVGNVVEIKDEKNNDQLSLLYDDLSRLIHAKYESYGSTLFNISYNYSAIGNIKEIKDSGNVMQYIYSALVHAPSRILVLFDENLPPHIENLTPDNQTNIGIHPLLEWDAYDPNNDPLEFTVLLAENENFTPLILNQTVYAPQLSVDAPLAYLTTYYWKVIASDGINITESETASFTTRKNESWSDDIRITEDESDSYNPSIAVDKYGNSHIVWVDWMDGNAEIYYSKRDSYGNPLLETKRITNNDANSGLPEIAVDSNNNVHIVWNDARTGNDEIFYSKLDEEGNFLVENTQLTHMVEESSTADLAIDSTNNIHVVWEDRRTGGVQIYYMKLNNDGVKLVNDTQITYAGASDYSSIITDPQDDLHVTWHDHRHEIHLYYLKLDNNGVPIGEEKKLTPDNHLVHAHDTTVDDSGNIHLIWQFNQGSVSELYYKKLNNSGDTLITTNNITTNAKVRGYPSISHMDGELHVAWFSDKDVNYEVYYALLDLFGTKRVDDTRLTFNQERSDTTHISAQDGVVAIVWRDQKDGNPEIYFKTKSNKTNSPPIISDLQPNNTTNASIFPLLSWNAYDPDNDTLEYTLTLALDSNFTTLLINETVQIEQFQAENLNYSTTYYWKIIATDDIHITESQTAWFKTKNRFNIPAPIEVFINETECGRNITKDITLEEDIECDNNGFIFGEDNIRLDCAGHSIKGNKGYTGININNKVRGYITNCSIEGFKTGLLINNSMFIHLYDNSFQSKDQGIMIENSNFTLIFNSSFINNEKGVDNIRSPWTEIIRSRFHNNSLGLSVSNSDFIDIRFNNLFQDNEIGIGINKSIFSNIINNDFINNRQQAIELNNKNSWNKNYWDDFEQNPGYPDYYQIQYTRNKDENPRDSPH